MTDQPTDRARFLDDRDLPSAGELRAERLERDAPDALLRPGSWRLRDEP
jgi:hypothetical protein